MNFKSNVYKFYDFDKNQTGDKLTFICKACVANNNKKTEYKGKFNFRRYNKIVIKLHLNITSRSQCQFESDSAFKIESTL